MNNKKDTYNSHNPIPYSKTKDKLPLEVGLYTLISVFGWRFLTVLLAAIPIVLFLFIAWRFSDYSRFFSAIFLSLASIVFLLFVVSLFRKKTSSFDKFLKRLIDISISFMLLVFMSPLMIIIGILIRIESKGPVFYSYHRLGRDGKLFAKLKFRTMYIYDNVEPVSAPENEKFIKLSYDSRITRIGKFLRKTSLDELPQIYNVLRGEMSLVGPPPLSPSELDYIGEKYIDIIKAAPPGITGLWQISLTEKTNEERIKLDEYYVENWSLWLDIIILARTFKSVFRSTGAY